MMAVDRSEFAVFAVGFSIAVPDVDIVILQIFDVRIASKEPQELVNDAFPVHFFRSEQGKGFAQVIARLHPEKANCARARAVTARLTLVENLLQLIEIVLFVCHVVDCWRWGFFSQGIPSIRSRFFYRLGQCLLDAFISSNINHTFT